MRIATHESERLPISHYWGLVKGLDRGQQLELATMIMEHLRDEEGEPHKAHLWDPETGEYLNEETMSLVERVRNGEEPMQQFDDTDDFKAWCEAL